MKKIWLSFLILYSCTTTAPTKDRYDLNYRVSYLEYKIDDVRCTTNHELCKLKRERNCFKKLQKCTIFVYRRWKQKKKSLNTK